MGGPPKTSLKFIFLTIWSTYEKKRPLDHAILLYLILNQQHQSFVYLSSSSSLFFSIIFIHSEEEGKKQKKKYSQTTHFLPQSIHFYSPQWPILSLCPSLSKPLSLSLLPFFHFFFLEFQKNYSLLHTKVLAGTFLVFLLNLPKVWGYDMYFKYNKNPTLKNLCYIKI